MIAPNLGSAWRYRHFIASSIRAEIRARFVRSRLGGLWMIIHPLAQAAILALVLAELMSAKLPGMGNDRSGYALYLLSGMLGWSLFAELVTRCLTLFIDNGNLLKKMLFPRICLPLIAAGSAVLNNALLFAAVVGVFALPCAGSADRPFPPHGAYARGRLGVDSCWESLTLPATSARSCRWSKRFGWRRLPTRICEVRPAVILNL
jgi:hypothetical protein